MPVQTQLLRPDPSGAASMRVNGDLRRHRRVPMELAGRFMRSNRAEHPCTLKDISVGSAFVVTEQFVEVGERIVAYFNHLGGLEGTVSRLVPDGFAFQFKVSDHKREKLSAQIMWLLNRGDFPDHLGREHARAGTTGRKTTLRFDDGMIVDVELLDLSESGASVRTLARPDLGEDITIGKIRSVVRRHHKDGIGVQFLTVLDQAALRACFP